VYGVIMNSYCDTDALQLRPSHTLRRVLLHISCGYRQIFHVLSSFRWCSRFQAWDMRDSVTLGRWAFLANQMLVRLVVRSHACPHAQGNSNAAATTPQPTRLNARYLHS
jgi:hypothetical protein